MSKTTSSSSPTGGTVSFGGSRAKAVNNDGIINASYTMNPYENDIYNYALSSLSSSLPKVNVFDNDTISSIKSQVNAYKEKGISEINDLYNFSLLDIENDSASRFGNLDNSIFMDKLSSMESERADAVNSFAQDVLSQESSLENNILDNRYDYINLLSGLYDSMYSNALNSISTALSGKYSSPTSSSSSTDYSSISKIASLLSSVTGSASTFLF